MYKFRWLWHLVGTKIELKTEEENSIVVLWSIFYQGEESFEEELPLKAWSIQENYSGGRGSLHPQSTPMQSGSQAVWRGEEKLVSLSLLWQQPMEWSLSWAHMADDLPAQCVTIPRKRTSYLLQKVPMRETVIRVGFLSVALLNYAYRRSDAY